MHRLLPAFLGLLVAAWAVAAPARAEPVSIMKLMAPGPLPEMALGDPAAPVSIVEYVSLTCSHCANFHAETFDALKTNYIDTGKVYYALREFPIDSLAFGAIMMARCAPKDQFFPIVQALFREQRNWAFVESPAVALLAQLEPFGFTEASFEACLGDGDLAKSIGTIAQSAQNAFGVHGTPTFFINGEKHVGAMGFAEMAAILDPLLAKN